MFDHPHSVWLLHFAVNILLHLHVAIKSANLRSALLHCRWRDVTCRWFHIWKRLNQGVLSYQSDRIIYKVFETTLDNSVWLEMRQIGPFTYLSCRSDGPMNLADTGNTQKTDKVYNFLQYAKLTCVGDLWTQALRSFSQSPRGNLGSTSLADVIWYIADRFSEFKGHPRRSTLRIGGNRRLCPFSVCCGSNFGENCR